MAVAVEQYVAETAERSLGVWSAAWKRLRQDRVGMTCLAIVAAFLVLILLSSVGLVAGSWQLEKGVPYANPTFLGDRPNVEAQAVDLVAPKGPPVDISDIDPLSPKYDEWKKRAAEIEVSSPPRATTLPFGGDRWGRDVLAKAVKGAQISIFVGVFAALLATLIGTVLGAIGGYFGRRAGDFLEWVYNVFTAIPIILLIFAFAAVVGRGIDTVIYILGLTGWTGIYRLVRAEYIKHGTREYVRAAQAIGASHALARLSDVRSHPAQYQPRGAGAAVTAGGRFHQVGSDPVVSRAGRADRDGFVGHDAG